MYHSFVDADTATLINVALRYRGQFAAMLDWEVRDRLQVLRVGLLYAPREADRVLKREFGPYIRVRLAIEQGNRVVIEHYAVNTQQGWLQVCQWPFDHPKRVPEGKKPWTIAQVVELLHECDMQRVGSKAWLLARRAASLKQREDNEAASIERTCAAVDQMGNPKNFLEVQDAMLTGDRITLHGADEHSFDQMRQASLQQEISEYQTSVKRSF